MKKRTHLVSLLEALRSLKRRHVECAPNAHHPKRVARFEKFLRFPNKRQLCVCKEIKMSLSTHPPASAGIPDDASILSHPPPSRQSLTSFDGLIVWWFGGWAAGRTRAESPRDKASESEKVFSRGVAAARKERVTQDNLNESSPFCRVGKVERFYGKSLTPPRRRSEMEGLWKGEFFNTKNSRSTKGNLKAWVAFPLAGPPHASREKPEF